MARAASIIGDPGSNPGVGEHFSFKLTAQGLPYGKSENLIFINNFSHVSI